MKQRTPRIHNEFHLSFIRGLPCILTGDNTSTEAAHIRFSDLRADKYNAGVGAKPDDFFVVPLSGEMHRRQHAMGNERKFWAIYGIDPIFYALALYAISGDHERGCRIVGYARPSEETIRGSLLANIMAAG